MLNQTISKIEANDFLDYYASIFTGICTLGLGVIAVCQNIKARETNKNLQALQLQLSQKAIDDKEIDELRKDITDIMISFDIDALRFAINKRFESDMDHAELRLYNVRKTASDTHAKFALSTYGNKCSDKCNSCPRTDCILTKRSTAFIESFSDFKKYYYEACINQFLKAIDDCNAIIFEVKKHRKRSDLTMESFETSRRLTMEKLETLRSLTSETKFIQKGSDEYKLYEKQIEDISLSVKQLQDLPSSSCEDLEKKWAKIQDTYDNFNQKECPALMDKSRKCLVQLEHYALQKQKNLMAMIKQS